MRNVFGEQDEKNKLKTLKRFLNRWKNAVDRLLKNYEAIFRRKVVQWRENAK
jgi:hypothetical protein